MAVTIKPTAAEVIADGQLQDGYFPNCTTHSAVTTLIDGIITDVDDNVQIRTGTYYTSTDDRILRQLHKAEIHLALSHLWQIIREVMVGYDAESLPPEYVDPDQAAYNSDKRAEWALEILTRYDGDTVQTPAQFVGIFDSGGADEDLTGLLGQTY